MPLSRLSLWSLPRVMLKAFSEEWSGAPGKEVGPPVLLVLSSEVPSAVLQGAWTESSASTRGIITTGGRTARFTVTTFIGTITITADKPAKSAKSYG
jgi:hypothetical protein